jgi:hypothetical protein
LPPRCPALGVDRGTIGAAAEARDDGGALAACVERKITLHGPPLLLIGNAEREAASRLFRVEKPVDVMG